MFPLPLLSVPLMILGFAFFRALVLFWPTMIVLGAAHSYIPMIPALGWVATFWLVVLFGLLIPAGAQNISNLNKA